MKTTQLMALALTAVACTVATAVAQDANDYTAPAFPNAPKESAPDNLLNPQPGMIFSAYGPQAWMTLEDTNKMKSQFLESLAALPKSAALKIAVDTGNTFSIECAKDVNVRAIRWEGYLDIKKAGTYTFVFQKDFLTSYSSGIDRLWTGYATCINGNVGCGSGQNSVDIDLNIGHNHVVIVCLYPDPHGYHTYQDANNAPFNMSIKRKGSIGKAWKISPCDFFHEQPIEDEKPPFNSASRTP